MHRAAAVILLLASLTACRGEREASRPEGPQPPSRSARPAQLDLRNPDRVLFGLFHWRFPPDPSGIVSLQKRLGFDFPILSFHATWGDKPENAFPADAVARIGELGSIPMITWEPSVTAFASRAGLPAIESREHASLAAIGRGDYDFYIEPWAAAAAAYGKPMFLRFAHEMNDPYHYPWGPQNANRPDDFIAAWRRVHAIFQTKGATNVFWIWSPNVSMPWFEYYYPGDHVVDWVAMRALNYGDVASWSRWWSFDAIVGPSYAAIARFNKPLMVAEFATLDRGGDMVTWYRDAFAAIERGYPAIRAVILFHQRRDTTTPRMPLNWAFTQNDEAAEIVARELVRLSSIPRPRR